jgi:hypothetical protein
MTADLLTQTQKKHAEAIAERAGQRCGFDPFTIIMVVCAVVQLAIKCWQVYHPQVSGETPHQQFARIHQENPYRLRHDLTANIFHARGDLTLEQSKVIADVIIVQSLDPANAEDFNALMEMETESEQ